MKELIRTFEELPLIVKVILCIPCLDIVWCIYRLCRSIEAKNTVGIIVAILTIIPGAFFVWLIDLICVLVKGKVWSLD